MGSQVGRVTKKAAWRAGAAGLSIGGGLERSASQIQEGGVPADRQECLGHRRGPGLQWPRVGSVDPASFLGRWIDTIPAPAATKMKTSEREVVRNSP